MGMSLDYACQENAFSQVLDEPPLLAKIGLQNWDPYYICRVNSWKTFGTTHFIPTYCLHENPPQSLVVLAA